MSSSLSFPLKDGGSIPGIGLGTWKLEKEKAGEIVNKALEIGYRHIDCAALYENEDVIGEVLKQVLTGSRPLVKREDLFITSKLWNTHHRPSLVPKALEKTLEDLGLQYLDLYLMHFPIATVPGSAPDSRDSDVSLLDTWAAMEALVKEGKVRAIGVANFNISRLRKLLARAEIKPVVNQVEMHPYLPQEKLLRFCQEHDIHVTAYSPLGSGGHPNLLEDSTVLEISRKLNKTPAQVLLAWGLQRVTSVIPKTSNVNRLKENFDSKFTLSQEDFEALCSLPTKHRFLEVKNMFGVDPFKESGEVGFVDL